MAKIYHTVRSLKTKLKVGQSESKGWPQLVTMHQQEKLVITAQATNF